MNPLKERTATTKAITTLLTLGLVASFAGTIISMPQMFGSVYAQSEQGSEHACKELPGGTLERGECTAPATSELSCKPSTVFGVGATRTGETCTATTSIANSAQGTAKKECEDIVVDGTQGKFNADKDPADKNKKIVTCTFPATETFDCPGDIIPTDQGLCITKPGSRT